MRGVEPITPIPIIAPIASAVASIGFRRVLTSCCFERLGSVSVFSIVSFLAVAERGVRRLTLTSEFKLRVFVAKGEIAGHASDSVWSEFSTHRFYAGRADDIINVVFARRRTT